MTIIDGHQHHSSAPTSSPGAGRYQHRQQHPQQHPPPTRSNLISSAQSCRPCCTSPKSFTRCPIELCSSSSCSRQGGTAGTRDVAGEVGAAEAMHGWRPVRPLGLAAAGGCRRMPLPTCRVTSCSCRRAASRSLWASVRDLCRDFKTCKFHEHVRQAAAVHNDGRRAASGPTTDAHSWACGIAWAARRHPG